MNRTPMEFWCWSCFALGRGLVNGSATFRSVCTLQISMSPFWTLSRMELKRRLMCLVFLWNLGSLASAIAPVLSQKSLIGPDALGMTPRSVMNSERTCGAPMFGFGNWWQSLWTNGCLELYLKDLSIGISWSPCVGFKEFMWWPMCY